MPRTRLSGAGGGVTHAHYARMIWNIFHQHRTEGALAAGIGFVYITPIQFNRTMTIDRIGVVIGTALGNIRVGIYEDNGDTPVGGDLLAESASVVAVANQKNELVIVPATLQLYGLYWFAFQYNNAGLVLPRNAYVGMGITLFIRRYAQAYGAFTDPCPGVVADDYSPIMYARIASTP